MSLAPPQSPALHPNMKCGVERLWDQTLVPTRSVGPAQLGSSFISQRAALPCAEGAGGEKALSLLVAGLVTVEEQTGQSKQSSSNQCSVEQESTSVCRVD